MEEGEEVERMLEWDEWWRIVETEGKEVVMMEVKGLWW